MAAAADLVHQHDTEGPFVHPKARRARGGSLHGSGAAAAFASPDVTRRRAAAREQVALHLAQWCNPAFASVVNGWVGRTRSCGQAYATLC